MSLLCAGAVDQGEFAREFERFRAMRVYRDCVNHCGSGRCGEINVDADSRLIGSEIT